MTAHTRTDDATADLARALAMGKLIDTTTGMRIPAHPNMAALIGETPHQRIVPRDDCDMGLAGRLLSGDLPVPDGYFAISWDDGARTTVLFVIPGFDRRSLFHVSYHRADGVWTTDLANAAILQGDLRVKIRPCSLASDPYEAERSVRERVVRETGVLLAHLAA